MREVVTLTGTYSKFAGKRTVVLDVCRIVDVIDVTQMVHPETRKHYDRVFEVRLDASSPLASYAVVGPTPIMRELGRIYAAIHRCQMETDQTAWAWCGALSRKVRECGYGCTGTVCRRQEMIKEAYA